jgi:beta-galactosidase
VLDAPGGWWDAQGRVLKTGKGTAFEKIFGASIADMQYSNNVVQKIDNHALDGFYFELTPTTAEVLETFQSGLPSVTCHKYGKGEALILGADASFAMKAPGNEFMEDWTIRHTMGDLVSPYSCEDAIVYRLAAPDADHYFFVNDDEAKEVSLLFRKYDYKAVSDPITGEELEQGQRIALDAYSARWLRFEK